MISDAQAWGIIIACVMMVADIASGFIAAVINNNISSTKMRKGLLHKVLVLVLIFACLAIEVSTSHIIPLPYDIPTCEVVCGYVIIMELMSILENIGEGYPDFKDSTVFKLFNFSEKDNDNDNSDV